MKRNAYTIVEILIAAAIVALGLAAAVTLAHSMLLQQVNTSRVARAGALQAQIATLYRLGYDAANITNILPESFVAAGNPGTNGYMLQFLASSNTATGPTSVEITNCRLIYNSARQTDGSLVFDTNDVVLVRPSIR